MSGWLEHAGCVRSRCSWAVEQDQVAAVVAGHDLCAVGGEAAPAHWHRVVGDQ